MTTYIEYKVKLTDGQKSKLASAIRNKTQRTLRLKHSQLHGSDELMLTRRQLSKIKKSLANGTGTDIKISKTQIRQSVKHGETYSRVSRLLERECFLMQYEEFHASRLHWLLEPHQHLERLTKLYGKGVSIPRKFILMLPPFAQEFIKSQRDQINKVYKTGGRLVIKPTRKQIEGGFLGTLASIGIPMAVSLVRKMPRSGLQVDRTPSRNTKNVYVPPVTQGEGHYYPYRSPPFNGTWENPPPLLAVQGKKKVQRQGSASWRRTLTRKKTAHSKEFPY